LPDVSRSCRGRPEISTIAKRLEKLLSTQDSVKYSFETPRELLEVLQVFTRQIVNSPAPPPRCRPRFTRSLSAALPVIEDLNSRLTDSEAPLHDVIEKAEIADGDNIDLRGQVKTQNGGLKSQNEMLKHQIKEPGAIKIRRCQTRAPHRSGPRSEGRRAIVGRLGIGR
jgi:hypothetical protein